MKQDTRELKKRVDVAYLLEHYSFERVEDKGEWLWALCPYHEDKNPSFAIRKEDTYFHCWSCKENGDAIRLVMDMENVDFKKAIEILSGLFGQAESGDAILNSLYNTWLKEKKNPVAQEDVLLRSERLIKLNWWAKFFFEEDFKNSKAQEYILNRGFRLEDAKKFDLGYYNPDSDFIEEARAKGYSNDELRVAGFLTEYGERFKDRLMFPIFDLEGNVVAFSARALSDEMVPKYTATQNSDYYKKGFFLYGLQNLQDTGEVILVEGNLDAVRLSVNGKYALAQLGSALTTKQCDLLKEEGFVRVTMLYDGDDAGKKSSYINVLPLVEKGVNVYVATLPPGFDPDTFVKIHGIVALDKILDSAMHGLEYYLYKSSHQSMATTIADCLRSIQKIKDKESKEYYVSKASSVFKLSEQSIKTELRKVR